MKNQETQNNEAEDKIALRLQQSWIKILPVYMNILESKQREIVKHSVRKELRNMATLADAAATLIEKSVSDKNTLLVCISILIEAIDHPEKVNQEDLKSKLDEMRIMIKNYQENTKEVNNGEGF